MSGTKQIAEFPLADAVSDDDNLVAQRSAGTPFFRLKRSQVINGLAHLEDGHLATSEIPPALLGGVNPPVPYDPVENTPSISAGGGGGVAGDILIVTQSGTVAVDDIGPVSAPDFLVNNGGTLWQRVPLSDGLGSMAAEDIENLNPVEFNRGEVLGSGDPRIPDQAFTINNPDGNVGIAFTDDGGIRATGLIQTPTLIAGAGSATLQTLIATSGSIDGMDVLGLDGGSNFSVVSNPRIPDVAFLFIDTEGRIGHAITDDGVFRLGDVSGVGGGDVIATNTSRPRSISDIAADYATPTQAVAIDNTGSTSVASDLTTAYNQARGNGHRYLRFTPGLYDGSALQSGGFGDMIFCGDGADLTGAYRIHIIPDKAPSWTPPTFDVVPSLHMRRFVQAVAAADAMTPARLCLIGDSTTAGGDQERCVRERLYQTFGPQARFIEIQQRGIGGARFTDFLAATWQDTADGNELGLKPSWWTNEANPWSSYVHPDTDLVIWNFGQNMEAGDYPLNPASLDAASAIIAGFATRFGLPPDQIFQTPYAPSNVNTTKKTRSNQGKRLAAAGLIRTWCNAKGYGVVDIGRYASVRRDGIDPLSTVITRLADVVDTTVAFPYAFPAETTNFRITLRIPSQKATLWDAGSLIIPLSGYPGNQLELYKDTGTGGAAVMAYQATDQPIWDDPVVTAGFNTASTGTLILQVHVFNNSVRLITGTTILFDGQVIRFGDDYTPTLAIEDTTPNITINDILVSLWQPYRAEMLDVEQFLTPSDDTDDFGNGDNHQARRGQELTLSAAYRNTAFA